MAVEIPYRREIAFEYGRLERVAPGIRRIVARNPGPFTFKGTGTYVVGEGEVAVIDPGPELEEHIAALLASLAEERVSHILITHTHRDHSPAAKALKAATGAPTYGFGPHAGGKRGDPGIEEGGDWDFVPNKTIGDGDLLGALGLARQLGRAVHRIDRGDDVAQAEMVPEHGVGLHGREDGERVGQAGAFDDQPPEARH